MGEGEEEVELRRVKIYRIDFRFTMSLYSTYSRFVGYIRGISDCRCLYC